MISNYYMYEFEPFERNEWLDKYYETYDFEKIKISLTRKSYYFKVYTVLWTVLIWSLSSPTLQYGPSDMSADSPSR